MHTSEQACQKFGKLIFDDLCACVDKLPIRQTRRPQSQKINVH